MTVGIIGAGASGMVAAIRTAEQGAQVLLLERQARVGRKLQATGNGRCNLSNIHTQISKYHGEQPDFCEFALKRFPVADILSWFAELGLLTVTEDSGKIYPYSDQANSVVDVLRFALDRPEIRLVTGCEVKKVRRDPQGFLIQGSGEAYRCDRLIIACGGLAGSKLGGSMSGYQLLRSFGHRATKLRPNLVQIKSSWGALPSLKGIRANCRVEILRNGARVAESTGELQFTEYGLSGPVMYEVSRDVCQGGGNWQARLDFLPQISGVALRNALERRKSTKLMAGELLTGILHNRLGRVLVQAAGIRGEAPISRLEREDFDLICQKAKAFEVELTEPLGMDAAQVTAGGVLTSEFDPETMESRLVPGLYACGEVLDIDGDCGGFNLQWAWSSGSLAGMCAGKELL